MKPNPLRQKHAGSSNRSPHKGDPPPPSLINIDQSVLTDPRDVGQGIAEALLTTAAGLVVAIIILFPYNAFRAQVDRTLGRIESLAAAASTRGTDAGVSSYRTGPKS